MGPLCTSTAPLCPQDQFLSCAFQQQAGSCLPCQPLPASPVFLRASLLPHGSISLSSNPNVDPLSNNQNVDHFSRAITQMGVLSLSSHPRVTVQVPLHSRAVPPRLCSKPALLLLPFSLCSSTAAALLPWPLPPPVPARTQLKGSGFTLALCCLCPAVGRVPRGCWGHGLLPGLCLCASRRSRGQAPRPAPRQPSPWAAPSLPPPHRDPSGQHKELRPEAPGESRAGSTRVLCPCPGIVPALACGPARAGVEPGLQQSPHTGAKQLMALRAVSHTVAAAPGPSSSLPHGADSI